MIYLRHCDRHRSCYNVWSKSVLKRSRRSLRMRSMFLCVLSTPYNACSFSFNRSSQSSVACIDLTHKMQFVIINLWMLRWIFGGVLDRDKHLISISTKFTFISVPRLAYVTIKIMHWWKYIILFPNSFPTTFIDLLRFSSKSMIIQTRPSCYFTPR